MVCPSGVRRMWTLGGGVYICAVRHGHLFLNLGLWNGIIPAIWQHFWAKSKEHKLCVLPLVSNTWNKLLHKPICDCSFGIIWINKNSGKTLLFIFAFLSSRGYWVEKSLNIFRFKNINLSMLEVWINSEIQIYNNNQTKYYRSWRMWLGGGTYGSMPPLRTPLVCPVHWLASLEPKFKRESNFYRYLVLVEYSQSGRILPKLYKILLKQGKSPLCISQRWSLWKLVAYESGRKKSFNYMYGIVHY